MAEQGKMRAGLYRETGSRKNKRRRRNRIRSSRGAAECRGMASRVWVAAVNWPDRWER